jgi:hypothetical protein
MKALDLLSVLPRDPREFAGRLMSFGEGHVERFRKRPVYAINAQQEALARLATNLGLDLLGYLAETTLVDIESRVRAGRLHIPADAPFQTFHNSDPVLARLSYALVRALRPKLVVETGVCYGVTSAHVLQALAVNDSGYLHSIDLPPLGKKGDDFVGWFVPNALRGRWMLHRGTSSRLLRPLLAQLGNIDLYIHDSLHTYRNMQFEFRLAWAALRGGGVLVSDDIEGNCAFAELRSAPDVLGSVVMPQDNKDSLLGVAIKRS